MSTIRDIDIIDICKVITELRVLENVKIYGRVTREINAPKSLSSDIKIDENCTCVCVEVVAINLSSYSQFLNRLNLYNGTGIYFANARMSAFVDRSTTLNDLHTLTGTLRLAKKTRTPVLAMYNFYKTDDSKWGIHATDVDEVDCDELVNSKRVLDYIIRCDAENKLILPDEVYDMKKCYEDDVDEFSQLLRDMSIISDERTTVKPRVTVTNNKVEKKSILELKVLEEAMQTLEKNLEIANISLNTSIAKLREDYPLDKDNEELDAKLEYMLQGVKTYATCGKTGTSLTGQALIKGYLEALGADIGYDCLGVPFYQFVPLIVDELKDYIFTGTEPMLTDEIIDLLNKYFTDKELLYAGVLGVSLGINTVALLDIARDCISKGISFVSLININPYLLYLIDTTGKLKVSELDSLYLVATNVSAEACNMRYMTVVYSTLVSNTDTACYKLDTLGTLNSDKVYLTNDTLRNIDMFIGKLNIDINSISSQNNIDEAKQSGIAYGLILEQDILGSAWLISHSTAQSILQD